MFESGGDKFKHPSEMYQDAIDTVKSSRSYSKERRKTVRAKRPAQQLKQAIALLERALAAGGSCRVWMEDVTTFVRSVRATARV